MNRRGLLATAATLAAGIAGCLGAFRSDDDGDGVSDSEDVAPNDSRVSRYGAGDSPVRVTADAVEWSDETVTVRLTHEGGDPFTAGDTERLEVAAEGETVATVALPFEVADTRTVRDVPVGPYANLVWFAHEGEGTAVVERWQFAN
jgi:hypothetical protein